MAKILNQYEAAALLAISPELLLYCTSYKAKAGVDRKLIVAKKEKDLWYFEEDELKDYDRFLREAWPSKEAGARPHLPDAFKNEVKQEASGECALCLANGNSCEAAHIASVAKSRCNHPHNLIWLCANHHTKFDKGWLGPKEDQNDLVKSQKYVLQYRRRAQWSQAADVTSQLAGLIKLAGATAKAAKSANEADQALAKEVAQNVLHLIPSILKLNQDEKLKPVLSKIKSAIEPSSVAGYTTDAVEMLSAAASFEQEFIRDAGLKDCPLCSGSRWHNGEECPVCEGEGAIPNEASPDLEPFELVDCRLCHGSGKVDAETCAFCEGDRQIERRVDERTDWNEFDKVDCSLCQGSGRRNGDWCPVCEGEKQLLRRVLDRISLDDYEEVDCPLCEGQGRFQGDFCPECNGDRRIERRFAEAIDVSKYDDELCGLCGGTGDFYGQTCPCCDGDKRVPKHVNDQLEPGAAKLVNCPRCRGQGQLNGDACPVCEGTGELPRFFADRMGE